MIDCNVLSASACWTMNEEETVVYGVLCIARLLRRSATSNAQKRLAGRWSVVDPLSSKLEVIIARSTLGGRRREKLVFNARQCQALVHSSLRLLFQHRIHSIHPFHRSIDQSLTRKRSASQPFPYCFCISSSTPSFLG